jgi:hypothetical protein
MTNKYGIEVAELHETANLLCVVGTGQSGTASAFFVETEILLANTVL